MNMIDHPCMFSKVATVHQLQVTDPFHYCVLATSKVLEKLVYQNVIEYLRPQLSLHQFGFLSNRSSLHKNEQRSTSGDV